MNKVTVVMPAYREKYEQIKAAIESILNQTYKDFQYIIVLDDSNNKELEILIRTYAEKDTRIFFYINEKNLGCPASKDRGIRLAKTKYVAIMDADDIAYPKRLEQQIKKMEREELDIIASYVRVIDEKGKPLYEMDNLPITHEKIWKRLHVNNCMPHPTWFLKKDMYVKLGGYANIQGCEDYDFLIRAAKEGYKLGMVNEILLDYRLSTQSISRNNLYKQYLLMRYVQNSYFRIRSKTLNYNEFEKKHYNEKKANKYAKASKYFEDAIIAKRDKYYLKMLVLGIKIIFTSREYVGKIVRYILQEI